VEQATHDLLAEKQPSLRFATVDDIGDLAVFLSGDAGRSITGVSLPVDGGWTAR
jgi:3-hydroxybutyrate dehydrogenase